MRDVSLALIANFRYRSYSLLSWMLPEVLMRWSDLGDESCSVARTLAVIGDRWTLMILRDCFLGVRRFDAFQERLNITTHIVADRLRKLVDDGILKKTPYHLRPPRYEYRLTPEGLDLYPVIMTMAHWGDTHAVGNAGRPLLHHHMSCGHQFDPLIVCSECRDPLHARSVRVTHGPGAGLNPKLIYQAELQGSDRAGAKIRKWESAS